MMGLLMSLMIVSGLFAQIADLPYSQDFDGVTAPQLPAGWQASASTPGANIHTDTIYPHSMPNCLRIFSSAGNTEVMYLIMPEVLNPIALSTIRLRFWLRASSYTTLSLGVMDDPDDPTSFVPVQSVMEGNAWKENIHSLASYSGTGRYIAFKYTPIGNNSYFWIDDLILENIPQNDLAVLSMTGNTTPSVGVPSPYQIGIMNYGLSAQSVYQVKLIGIAGTELASVDGVPIAFEQTVNVTVVWTPTLPGYEIIRTRVVLAGDEIAGNNESAPMQCAVQTATTDPPLPPVTEPARIPMDFYYKNSLCQYILSPNDIFYPGFTGVISSIRIHNNFVSNLPNIPTRIWLGTTPLSHLGGGWIPMEQLTLVFDGPKDYPSGQNIINYDLIEPYEYYNGQNLVVMFQRPMDTDYYNSFDRFTCQNLGPNRSRRVFSDYVSYDPANPPATADLSPLVPVTHFITYAALVGNISGIVTDNEGIPIAGVDVQLGTHSAQTSASGSYEFTNIPVGTYEQSFSKYGFYPFWQNLTLMSGQNLIVETVMYRAVGFLVGIVSDEDGNRLQGVSAAIGDMVAVSDDQGIFEFAIPVGLYDLVISKPGYITQTLPGVEVLPDEFNQIPITLLTEVSADDTDIPSITDLSLSNHPNPFLDQTRISFVLPKSGLTQLSIYNLKGQRVRLLTASNLSGGDHIVAWNGKDDNGKPLPSGIYLARLTQQGRTQTRKLMLIK